MKKIILIFYPLCLVSIFLLCTEKLTIQADETVEPPIEITIEVNDIDAVIAIKQQVLQTVIDEKIYNDVLDDIDLENSEIKIDNLDITNLGSKEVTLHISLKYKKMNSNLLLNNTISAQAIIHVVDTTAPTITLKYDTLTLEYQEEYNPYSWIQETSDNSLDDLASVYAESSSINTSAAGEYTLHYYATDQSGNVATTSMLIHVLEEKITPVVSVNFSNDDDLINEMLTIINEERATRGLHALVLAPSNAQQAITVRACEAKDYVSHTRPDGSHYKTAFDDYNVTYSSPYEVLTYSGTSVQDKLDWWMGSPGHRDILMRQDSSLIAIGYCDKMWAAIVYD